MWFRSYSSLSWFGIAHLSQIKKNKDPTLTLVKEVVMIRVRRMFKKILIIAFILVALTVKASDYGTVFSDEAAIPERWKQVYPLAKSMSQVEANAFLVRCINSRDWFLQLAALKSYGALFPEIGLIKARHLLKKSPSLVVRSEAVHYIKNYGDIKDVTLLFDALLSSKNFKGKHSLSIRLQIIEAIESVDVQNIYRKRWQKLRHDSNARVSSIARIRFNSRIF